MTIGDWDFYEQPEMMGITGEEDMVTAGRGFVAASDQQIQKAIETLREMAAKQEGSFALFAYRHMTEEEVRREGYNPDEGIGRRMEIIAGITAQDEVHPDIAAILFYKTLIEMLRDVGQENVDKVDARLRDLGFDPTGMEFADISAILLEADGYGDGPDG